MTRTIKSSSWLLAIADEYVSISSSLLVLGSPNNHDGKEAAEEIGVVSVMLRGIGQKIQDHENLIKWNEFDKIFGPLLRYFDDKLRDIVSALHEAKSNLEDLPPSQEGSDEEESPKERSQWGRFKRAFGKDNAWDFLMEECCDRVKQLEVLQILVSLAVLQSTGESQVLSTEQRSDLAALKGGIKWLLTNLRENELLSVNLRASVPSILPKFDSVYRTQTPICTKDDDDTTPKIPKKVPSIPSSLGGSTKASLFCPSVTNGENKETVPALPPWIIYEAWLVMPSVEHHTDRCIRFLGISKRVSTIVSKDIYQFTPIPGSQDELKAYASTISAKNPKASMFETILGASHTHSALSGLLQTRDRASRTRHWTIEAFTEIPTSKSGWFRRSVSHKVRPSYLVILKGGDEVKKLAPCGSMENPFYIRPLFSPPPPPTALRRPFISSNPKTPKIANVKVTLTQKEAESVINDFLASFTNLFENVPYEQRGAVLNSVEVPPDYDYDSDSSSSSASSLGDD